MQVNTAPGRQFCNYPPNSAATCTQDNPCGFVCINGWTGIQCNVCPLPNNACFGPAGPCSPAPCPSGVVSPPRRREQILIDALKKTCIGGQQLCRSWRGAQAEFECVDTRNTLDSCSYFFCSLIKSRLLMDHNATCTIGGGCILPLPDQPATGRDCSEIPGVRTVSCQEGKCVVEACDEFKGWEVSPQGNMCLNQSKHSDLC